MSNHNKIRPVDKNNLSGKYKILFSTPQTKNSNIPMEFRGLQIFNNKSLAEEALRKRKKLTKVLELKKLVNQETFTSGQYTVQIFSGNFKDSQELMNKIKEDEDLDEIFFIFETPYYKIRVGKFVSKIKAIKELKKIKKKYPSAFILKPN